MRLNPTLLLPYAHHAHGAQAGEPFARQSFIPCIHTAWLSGLVR